MSTTCRIRYLGHSAWLAETPARLLLFDYGDVPLKMSGGLSSGRIDFSELPNLPLYAFSSHWHPDHYSANIHRKVCERSNAVFFMGMDRPPNAVRAAMLPACTQPAWPGRTLTADDLTVTCSGSTDSGVSFLVESPEGVFYHGGDLAVWDDGDYFAKAYRKEIDFLADRIRETGRAPDIAFLPVSTSDGYQELPLLEGVRYASQKMRPLHILPMHAHGFEELYRSFAGWAKGSGLQPVLAPENPGDCFDIETTGLRTSVGF